MTNSASLVAAHGWDAHLEAHSVFDAHIVGLHDADAASRIVLALDLRHQLVSHLRFEDRQVLPHLPEDVAAQVERDHAMLRDKLEALETRALLAHFQRVDERRVKRAVVELDRLLDHHDDRETRDVYPMLATTLDDATKAGLLEGFAATSLASPLDAAAITAIVEHPTVRALMARYRAWLDGSPLPAVPLNGLNSKASKALPKLLARDDKTVASAREEAPARERARRDMLAEVAVTGTLRFVLDALPLRS